MLLHVLSLDTELTTWQVNIVIVSPGDEASIICYIFANSQTKSWRISKRMLDILIKTANIHLGK